MKQILLSMILYSQCLIAIGQTSINGKYCLGKSCIKFTKDFNYYFLSRGCTGNSIDSGYYSLRNDTIYFNSLIQMKDIKSNIKIWDESWMHKKNIFIDTINLSVKNYTKQGFVYDLELKLNDSILFHTDAINYHEENQFKVPIYRNSDDGMLTVNVFGVNSSIPIDKDIFLQITFKSDVFTPLTDKFIYKKNKIYSIDFLTTLNKKVYLYKQ